MYVWGKTAFPDEDPFSDILNINIIIILSDNDNLCSISSGDCSFTEHLFPS